jgi:hypothetical protein
LPFDGIFKEVDDISQFAYPFAEISAGSTSTGGLEFDLPVEPFVARAGFVLLLVNL